MTLNKDFANGILLYEITKIGGTKEICHLILGKMKCDEFKNCFLLCSSSDVLLSDVASLMWNVEAGL